MIRNLMELGNVHVDAGKKAKVELKRGMFVKGNEVDGTIEIATNLADAQGIVVRDTKVTEDVAMDCPISVYDEAQDTILVGEFAGIRGLYGLEQWATDQVKDGVADSAVVAGKYLAVENGLLIASPSNAVTSLVSLGYINDAGHRILAFKVVK